MGSKEHVAEVDRVIIFETSSSVAGLKRVNEKVVCFSLRELSRSSGPEDKSYYWL